MLSGEIDRKILGRIEDIASSRPVNEEDKADISKKYGIPASQVESVTSFYSQNSHKDKVCTGLPCHLKRNGKPYSRKLEKSSCLGYCDHGPVVQKGGRYYRINDSGLEEIEESKAKFVDSSVEDIRSYMTRGGYTALEELIGADDDSYVLRKLEQSELKGMGGAGFPAHLKWKSFRKDGRRESYLLVNAHEGEPGTFKDRKIMELFPHTVIEGALIAAFYNSIDRIVIGLKEEYRNAYASLVKAIGELRIKFGEGSVASLLPEIEIIRMGGSYVTGEETALMEAIEDRRSEPRLRPPFPTEKGLFGKPTIVHNVETLSLVPDILRNGPENMRKVYCISGDVENPGTASISGGISAKELVSLHGKTDPNSLKAFLPGGLSGGFLPHSRIDTGLDSESLRKAGASLGTGAFIALSDGRCMVDITYEISKFFEKESCGKCAPCRLGTRDIREILARFRNGDGTEDSLASAGETAQAMLDGSICALGQAAGKVFLDSVRHFGNEYKEHISGVCTTGSCAMGGNGA